MAIAAYENYQTGDDGGSDLYGANWLSQSFTPATTHYVTSVWVKLKRTGACTSKNISAMLYATSSHLPTGSALVTGSLVVGATDLIDTSDVWYGIPITTPYSVTASTEYAIVLKFPDGDGTHKYTVRTNSAGAYAGGQFGTSSNSGSSWTATATTDMLFIEYGETAAAQTKSHFAFGMVFPAIATSKSMPWGVGVAATQRLPTDPLFYATITLQNVVNGSDYWIAQNSDLTNVLASGTQAGSADIVLANIPAYANPMLFQVRVRKAGYVPLTTFGNLVTAGSIVYVAQTADTIYTP
jgi:hypothetical protein